MSNKFDRKLLFISHFIDTEKPLRSNSHNEDVDYNGNIHSTINNFNDLQFLNTLTFC